MFTGGDAPSASSSQATDGAAVAAPSEVKPKSSEGGGGALHATRSSAPSKVDNHPWRTGSIYQSPVDSFTLSFRS